jgi:transcriptional regulator with XRE-family HTH domain
MMSLGSQIRKLRSEKGLPLRKVAAELDIDQSILSKIERGERKASRELIQKMAKIFEVEEKALLVNYLSDKILYEVGDDDCAIEALKVAEQQVKYRTKQENGK